MPAKVKVKAVEVDFMNGTERKLDEEKPETYDDINEAENKSINDCNEDPVVEDINNEVVEDINSGTVEDDTAVFEHNTKKEKENINNKQNLEECPNCKKVMTRKSLKYKHPKVCKGRLQENTVKEPVEKIDPGEAYFDAIREYRNKLITKQKEKTDSLVKNMFGKSIYR
jgi:hypothetical protein